MEQLEREARTEGKTLLVLDAVTGGDAARLYERIGWNTVGVIPNYALYPDGRLCDTTVFWKTILGQCVATGASGARLGTASRTWRSPRTPVRQPRRRRSRHEGRRP